MRKEVLIAITAVVLIGSFGYYFFLVRPEQRLREEADYYRSVGVWLVDVTNVSRDPFDISRIPFGVPEQPFNSWEEFKDYLDPVVKTAMMFEVSSAELREIVEEHSVMFLYVDQNAKTIWIDASDAIFYWKIK